jgi:uncharacterized membrane protein YgdD (TMEM256/DUF423 family)
MRHVMGQSTRRSKSFPTIPQRRPANPSSHSALARPRIICASRTTAPSRLNLNSRWILAIAGVLLALATVAGAFGAHALQGRLAPERLNIYETAVRYQFYHALGLLAIGLFARITDAPILRWPALLVIVGIVLFSGSIYALSFGAPRMLGIITPLGGLALIAGWIVFVVAVLMM